MYLFVIIINPFGVLIAIWNAPSCTRAADVNLRAPLIHKARDGERAHANRRMAFNHTTTALAFFTLELILCRNLDSVQQISDIIRPLVLCSKRAFWLSPLRVNDLAECLPLNSMRCPKFLTQSSWWKCGLKLWSTSLYICDTNSF